MGYRPNLKEELSRARQLIAMIGYAISQQPFIPPDATRQDSFVAFLRCGLDISLVCLSLKQAMPTLLIGITK